MGILNSKYLSSFGLLVRCTHKLLSETITTKDLRKCKLDLIYFTAQCEELYGKSSMTFNTHALLHIVDHVNKSGPLQFTSAFPYENGIYILKQKLSGPKGASVQISKRFVQKMVLETELLNSCDNNASRFCKSILLHHFPLEGSTLETTSGVTLLANDNRIDQNIEQALSINIADIRLQDVRAYNKAVYKNVLFTATCYKRDKKTDDRFFQDISGNIVEVYKIIFYNNEAYIVGYKYKVKCVNIEDVIIDSIFEIISKSYSLHLLTLENIKKKVVYVNVENGYFCLMPNICEIQ